MRNLDTLIREYPLAGFSIERFDESMQFEGLDLKLVGLMAQSESLGEVTASAAGQDDLVPTRAYFELIERVAILQHGVLSPPPSGETWVYSRSNGVAAHITHARACAAAAYELIERDRILRSWYGQIPPEPISVPETPETAALRAHYDLSAHSFGQNVVALFGLPKNPCKPVLMGFGSAASLAQATQRAVSEALQRTAFLWDEEISETRPEFVPSVDYHLDFFLHASSYPTIAKWLRGENMGQAALMLPEAPGDASDISYQDITPAQLTGKAFVVKAVSERRLALTFGRGHPSVEIRDVGLSERLLVHPIA